MFVVSLFFVVGSTEHIESYIIPVSYFEIIGEEEPNLIGNDIHMVKMIEYELNRNF